MSKEMMVIAFGAWIIVVRTLLGVPGSWQTALLIVSGIGLMVIGFLLRGEAIGRSTPRGGSAKHSYSFVESLPADQVSATSHPVHEHKEGLTSL